MKVLKIGILGLFLAEYKMHYLVIFLTKVYIVTGRDASINSYLPKMNLFFWTAFFPMSFESSLETLIVIFQMSHQRVFFWLIIKNFEISVLTGILDNRQPLLMNSYPAIYSWVQNKNQCKKRVVRLPTATIEG